MSNTNGAAAPREPRLLEWNGEQRTAYAWAKDPRVAKLGLTGTGIAFRVGRGWTDVEALTTPKGETPARIAQSTPRPHGPARGTPKRERASTPPSSPADEVRAMLAAIDPAELLRLCGWDVEERHVPAGRVLLVKENAS